VDVQGTGTRWYRRGRYLLILVVLVALVASSLVNYLPKSPKTSDQVRLDMTISYFVHSYSPTVGLISETPGGSTFWLYSDNYLSALAISRYDPKNLSTSGFVSALLTAFGGYASTLPSDLARNQYTALNSTTASFDCSANYTLSWASAQETQTGGSASLKTTANDHSPACASENYADLLFLQALYYHRLGNGSEASQYYNLAAADFDGKGVADIAFNGSLYQTYKLALFVYTSSCLGRAAGTGFGAALDTLLRMQDNSTGGFYTGYTPALSHDGTTVNTETTALAALALEQLIHPSSSC
jgi:hypothetical protein